MLHQCRYLGCTSTSCVQLYYIPHLQSVLLVTFSFYCQCSSDRTAMVGNSKVTCTVSQPKWVRRIIGVMLSVRHCSVLPDHVFGFDEDGRWVKGSERSTRLDGLFWPRLGTELRLYSENGAFLRVQSRMEHGRRRRWMSVGGQGREEE